MVKSLTLCIIWGWCHIQRCSGCILDQKGKTLRWCRSGQKGESSRIKFEDQSALQRWHLGMKKINKVYYVGLRPFWTTDTICTGGGWQALKNVRDADSDQWLSYLWEISIMVKERKKAQENEVCCEPFIFWGDRAAVVFPSPLMKPPSAWANRPPSSFQRSREWWRGASLYSVRPLMESLTEREELGMESEDSKKKKKKRRGWDNVTLQWPL